MEKMCPWGKYKAGERMWFEGEDGSGMIPWEGDGFWG
jgi:hypothetical protein